MMNLSKKMRLFLSAISVVALVGGNSPLAAKTRKAARANKVSRQSVSQQLQDSLPLPEETIIGTEDSRVRGLVYGSLAVDDGPVCIQTKASVPRLDNSYQGRAQPDDIRCAQGRRDFECIPEDEKPPCAKANVLEDTELEASACRPLCTPGCVPQFVNKDVFCKVIEGVVRFDPKRDALLVRFSDASRRAPGANIQLSWLGAVQPTSKALDDRLVTDAQIANSSNTTSFGLMTAKCRNQCADPCQSSQVPDRWEFINDFWVPVKVDADLFVHPCMVPMSSAVVNNQNSQLNFHAINSNPAVSASENTNLVARTRVLYPQFNDNGSLIDPVSDPNQFEMNVSFNYAGEECPGNWVRLGLFPEADPALDNATGRNGGHFYRWVQEGGVDDGTDEVSCLRPDTGILCYKVCSCNILGAGTPCGGNNPSVIRVGTCEASLIDCLCDLGLSADTFNQILDLIAAQGGDEDPDPAAVARMLSTQRDLLRSVVAKDDSLTEATRKEVVDAVDAAMTRKANLK